MFSSELHLNAHRMKERYRRTTLNWTDKHTLNQINVKYVLPPLSSGPHSSWQPWFETLLWSHGLHHYHSRNTGPVIVQNTSHHAVIFSMTGLCSSIFETQVVISLVIFALFMLLYTHYTTTLKTLSSKMLTLMKINNRLHFIRSVIPFGLKHILASRDFVIITQRLMMKQHDQTSLMQC